MSEIRFTLEIARPDGRMAGLYVAGLEHGICLAWIDADVAEALPPPRAEGWLYAEDGYEWVRYEVSPEELAAWLQGLRATRAQLSAVLPACEAAYRAQDFAEAVRLLLATIPPEARLR